MKTLEGGHKDEERGTGRASGAGVAMLQKDMPGGRQVKERRTPRSVEFAFAFHVDGQDGDGLLHVSLGQTRFQTELPEPYAYFLRK
jgi:hypothetical protein